MSRRPPDIPRDDDPDYRRTCTKCGRVRDWVVAVCPRCKDPEFRLPRVVQGRLVFMSGGR
jgi:hypothetical protein